MTFAAQARAQDPIQSRSPLGVAESIYVTARGANFAELEDFGRASLKVPAPERLNRLYHVAWIFLSQLDFKRFDAWNRLLQSEATKVGDKRFQAIAELNALCSREDQGDTRAEAEIARRSVTEPDWFARIHAMRLEAYVMVHKGRIGDALRLLADADALVVERDRLAGTAREGILEIKGLALMELHDLPAAAAAFGRSQFEYGPHYPRPDFDGLYNMTVLAATEGDIPLASKIYAYHHQLAAASDLSALKIWDRNLCATVAEARDAPRDVLACFRGLSDRLGAGAFLAARILPARAIAEARTGDLVGARRDLDAFTRLETASHQDAARLDRLPLVRAEVLRAEGRTEDAYDRLRSYSQDIAARRALRLGAAIGQLTGEMDKQLGQRREQLAIARRDARLQHDVIRLQVLFEGVCVAIALAAVALLFWQWRLAVELRRARKTADEANSAKSDFLANMSHEIRTPLNGVVAVAEMLARADLAPREQEMAEIIRASGDTLQRLLSDILDLSRIESGKITIEAAPFHIGDMVRAVAGLSQLRCDEKGVKLEVSVAPELERSAMGDLVRVRQVVSNLLSNAVKFTEQGEIRLAAEPTPDGMVRFTVSDTGVGFDMADKGKVLGRFQQADSSITRRFGGTGLGLAICGDLAGLMGGVLDCASAPGVGSRFWLVLPLPEAEAPIAVAPDEDLGPDVGPTLRILLADDHPTNRKVVDLMLSGGIAELTSVEDGQQALAAFRTNTFDLILMDMQMPVMDGLTAIRAIRAVEAQSGARPIPIVMLTANALPEHVAAASAAGADMHLAKPFTAQALFDAVAAVCVAERSDEEIAA